MGLLNLGGLSADCLLLEPIQWAGAFIMVAGIFEIAVNPAKLLRRSGKEA